MDYDCINTFSELFDISYFIASYAASLSTKGATLLVPLKSYLNDLSSRKCWVSRVPGDHMITQAKKGSSQKWVDL